MGRIVGKIQFAFITVLLFTLNGFAGGAIAGKVTIVKGQVFIVRSGEKIQVKKDTTVLESDVIESQPGGTARITMIDSNLVDVYPKSKVEIAKYVYKPNQDQKDVELKVDFGKIKSTVNQKYDGAKNKFQVKTPSAVAGVRGTVFTAEYDAVKKVSKVVTIEGLVAVTKIIDRERQTPPVFVRPDQVVKVDAEIPKAEQPRDLKSDEREERKQEDKDLGYQYDPKKEPTPPASGEAPSSKNESPNKNEQASQPPREQQPPKEVNRPAINEEQARPPVTREAPPIKDQPVKEVQAREPVRETPPIKEISAREPVKADKEERRREQPQTLREAIKDAVKNASEQRQERRQERQQERQAEQQEKRQTASEDQQAKKQKQTEDEQAKKQKQLEEEQARKQKQSEEEQAKKQKQMEEDQARKQKQSEEEQAKKQKQMEENQTRKQKQSEEEQAKKQKQMEDMLAAKRKHAEEAQAKREEEQKKRAEEQQARRAELARRLAEIAKRAETVIRLPSGTTGGSTTPTSPINTIIPKQ